MVSLRESQSSRLVLLAASALGWILARSPRLS